MATLEYRKYEKILETLGDDTLPRVIAESINNVAQFAHVATIKNVKSRMILRNNYTVNSIKFYKANPKAKIEKINAVSGSISPYMDEQESGGYRLPKTGSKAPVAAMPARGGNSRRTVRKRFSAGTLGENQFVGTPRGGNRPSGVYERYRKNKRLRMIRNLENTRVRIIGTHWHTDGVNGIYTSANVSAEFIRLAKIELAKLGAT